MASRLSFAAQVKDWQDATEQKLERVFREAASEVIDQAVTNAPVDTGFLRNSVEVVINGAVPPATRANPGGVSAPVSEYSAVIVGARLGDAISAGWTANYALYVEFGTSKMTPRRFVGRAVQNWQTIVDRVVARHRR